MKKNMAKYREWFFGYLFIAPTFIGLLLFLIGPIFYALYISFTSWNGLSAPVLIGLENYVKMFNDPVMYKEMANTLIYVVFTVPITIALAVILANFLNLRIPCVGFFRVAFFVPYVTLPVASAMVWESMFNSKFGMVNSLLNMVGIPSVGWLLDTRLVMTIIIMMGIWTWLGYYVIILLVGLKNIDRTYYEAAQIDGANGAQRFFSITIPLLTPQIFFVTITATINAFKVFDPIFIFGKNSAVIREGVRTMVYGIYERGFTFQEMGYASAESVVLLIVILCITVLQFVMQKKWVHY